MLIIKTFRFRLKPNSQQRKFPPQFAGSCRFVYNYGLSRFKEALDKGIFLSYAELCKEITHLKAQPDTEWLGKTPAQALQQSLKDLRKDLNAHFIPDKNSKKSGFPKFKKRGNKDSFRYPQHIKVKDGRVFLPKIGWVKYFDSRQIEGAICQATVKRQGKHWFVSLVSEIEKEVSPIAPNNIVAIDVGVKNMAVLSTGEIIENPHFLKKRLNKLKREQRKLSKKRKEAIIIKNSLPRLQLFM